MFKIKVYTGFPISYSLITYSIKTIPLVKYKKQIKHPAHVGRKKKGGVSKW